MPIKNTTFFKILKKIDKTSSTPIYIQLRERIKLGIKDLPIETKLPPEKKISEVIKINPRTIAKAISTLIDEGILTRSVKGTFIAKKLTKNISIKPHPFNFHDLKPVIPRKTVKFASYENLPTQKKCWNAIAEKFNQSQQKIYLEIKHLPVDISTIDMYSEYIDKESIDIAMIPCHLYQGFISKLAPLPKSIKEKITSSDYLSSNIQKTELFDNFNIIFHYSLSGIIFNSQLCPDLLIPSSITAENFVSLLLDADKQHLPITLLASCWNLMLLFGLPQKKLTLKKLEIILEKSFYLLEKLSKIKNSIDIRSADSNFSIPNFIEGNTFSYLGSIGMLQQNTEDYDKFKIRTLNPPSESKLTSGITFGGVVSSSSLQSEAFAVLDFLSSRQAQDLIATYGMNCACYESSNCLLQGIDALEITKITPRLSMNNTLVSDWYWVLCYGLYPIIQDLILKNTDISYAVKNAVNIIKNEYSYLVSERKLFVI